MTKILSPALLENSLFKSLYPIFGNKSSAFKPSGQQTSIQKLKRNLEKSKSEDAKIAESDVDQSPFNEYIFSPHK